MLTSGTVKKSNKAFVTILMIFILFPIAALLICFIVCLTIKMEERPYFVLIAGAFISALLWYCAGGWLYQRTVVRRTEEQLSALKKLGITIHYTFHSSCIIMIDTTQRKVALQFGFNPFQCFVIPAERITDVWVDDGKRGKWFFQGSRKVHIMFLVDGVQVNILTFYSLQRYRMESKEVLSGIRKAGELADELNNVRNHTVQLN